MGKYVMFYIDRWLERPLAEFCKTEGCTEYRAIKVILTEYLYTWLSKGKPNNAARLAASQARLRLASQSVANDATRSVANEATRLEESQAEQSAAVQEEEL